MFLISIHALREEGDSGYAVYQVGSRGISIHALREEGDYYNSMDTQSQTIFLSTPSARRATLQKRGFKRRMVISIHALREEGDAAFPRP